ncbi:DNA-binding response regulator, OmpR family, contains REC and winged-helix (wHTH) domain [Streptomyces sp. DvalAA-14]|uniref:response regulator transcription factor n=1 Tax=unclassified Streptomyces TaxID=2593676 RepID=UPI00081BB1FE|nr:response regulator transcription factor [Streptomyces sp. DvalAA-14]MYS19326.1 response regulator [Streptomyces sp. SID4948]SCD41906.1 DNA-binding response regulator, OmpR family, contains REC and winged-helix (wHTH) domain [Streptomyces sp. DvalAA-14]
MRILVVEAHKHEALTLARNLERYGHDVTIVDSGTAAVEHHRQADFVLLDLDLPDIDGLAVCRMLRETGGVPMIAFAGGGTELDRVLGLRAGADDCLDKPYEIRELAARMEAVMRRREPRRPAPAPKTTVSIGALRIDAASREVQVHEKPVELTRKEFDLLYYLARHPEMVVTRQRLMAEIWEIPMVRALGAQASRTVDTHVSSLRSKLGCSSWIVTVRGVGFRVGVG